MDKMFQDESSKQKLYSAISKAQAACTSAGKSGTNDYDKYDYATLHDYCEVVRPAMASNGLALTINVANVERLPDRKTSNNKDEHVVVVTLTGRLLHESGEFEDYIGYGEGQDRADKAIYKAITGGKKYLISNIFNVPTTDDPERDEGNRDQPNNQSNQQRQPASTPPSSNGQAAIPPKKDKPKIPSPPKERMKDKKLDDENQKKIGCITSDQAKGLFLILETAKVDTQKFLSFISSELGVSWWDIQEKHYAKVCMLATKRGKEIEAYVPSSESGKRYIDLKLNANYQYFNDLLSAHQVEEIEGILIGAQVDPIEWYNWIVGFSQSLNAKVEKLIDVPSAWYVDVLTAAKDLAAKK
jgi:hypothetical protein